MLNREIAETSIRGMFVTMVAGIFNPVTKEVILANAGHLPALHMGCAALIDSYPANAPPLGVVPQTVFQNEKFNLQNGSLYLYSDGLLEARISDQSLKEDGLIRLFREQSHLPVEERAQAVVDAVFCPEGIVDDDLTLLIIEGQDQHAS
jgi:sigma-B regulation protein RsbU (phosphoserine phosphatase)